MRNIYFNFANFSESHLPIMLVKPGNNLIDLFCFDKGTINKINYFLLLGTRLITEIIYQLSLDENDLISGDLIEPE